MMTNELRAFIDVADAVLFDGEDKYQEFIDAYIALRRELAKDAIGKLRDVLHEGEERCNENDG